MVRSSPWGSLKVTCSRCAKAKSFAVIRSNLQPPTEFGLPFHAYEIGWLGELPAGGRLVDSQMRDTRIKARVTAPFKDGQLDYGGPNDAMLDSNSFIFEGPVAEWASPLQLSTKPRSLQAFKAANKLQHTPWQNVLTVVTPGGAWKAGQVRQLYLYHQLAYEGQLIFLNVPKWGAHCIDGKLAVPELTDDSLLVPPNTTPDRARYQVLVSVVACKSFTGPVAFKVAVGVPSA